MCPDIPFSGYGFCQQDTQLVRIIQRSAHGTGASIWGELPEEHTSCARVGHLDKSEQLSTGCQAKIPLFVPFPVTDPFKGASFYFGRYGDAQPLFYDL